MLKIGLVIILISTAGFARHGEVAKSAKVMCAVEMTELSLWDQYWTFGGINEFNSLLEWYLPLVESIADAFIAKNDLYHLDMRGGLISDGCDGLRDAIGKFDKGRKTKFATYASTRIKGAMMDGLRRMDFVPRLVRQQQKKWDAAVETLVKKLEREPRLEEIRIQLGMTEAKFEEMRQALHRAARISIDNEASGEDGKSFQPVMEKLVAKADLGDPTRKQKLESLQKYFKVLNRDERRILTGHFVDEKSLKQIGQEMDLSESRISQMRTAALTKILNNVEIDFED